MFIREFMEGKGQFLTMAASPVFGTVLAPLGLAQASWPTPSPLRLPTDMLDWQIATVQGIRQETPTVKTFTLALPGGAPPHRAGQHVDLRLVAPDGYQAQRSYSVASPPERTGTIDLTVERLDDGEVSTYLHDVVVQGDRIEVRGPVGGYFVWDAATATAPLLLVAGGSGVVPLMSILRHRAEAGATLPTRLLYSARSLEDVIYRDELVALGDADDALDVIVTLTRKPPPGWSGYARRVDAEMLGEVAAPLGLDARAYVCGPTMLVEAVASTLVGLGLAPEHVLTERFGPTCS